MQSFRKQICKRIILNQYLNDRKNRIECETNEVFCEKCQHIDVVNKVNVETREIQFIDFSESLFMTQKISFASFVIIANDEIFNLVVANNDVVFFLKFKSFISSSSISFMTKFCTHFDDLFVVTISSFFVQFIVAHANQFVFQSINVAIVERHRQRQREIQQHIRQFRKTCDHVRKKCAYCYFTTQSSNHYMFRCIQLSCAFIKNDCAIKKTRMRFRRELISYDECIMCFMSQT